MITSRHKRLQLGAALLAGSLAAAGHAQVQYPAGAVVQPLPGAAGEDLARHLRNLAEQPRNLAALLGAGQSALDLGDPKTALTFFARAEEAAPRDGRAKAGMGSAFVQMEQPQAALKFFTDAELLGIDPRQYAGNRGLAYDMVGDPARAQADYRLALRSGSDAEIERRLALSLAITGDREEALAVLEPQLQRQETAGWRARAFVLALTGDATEASRAVKAVMPVRQANAIQPFLERLPQLGSAEKAMAVHFGHFPTQIARSVAPAGRPGRGEPALGGVSPVMTIGGSTTRRSSRRDAASAREAQTAEAAPKKEAPATRTVTRLVPRIGSRFPVRQTVTVPVKAKPDDEKVVAGQPRPVQPIASRQAQPLVPGQPRPAHPISEQVQAAPPPASLQPALVTADLEPSAADRPKELAAASDFGAVVAAVQSLAEADEARPVLKAGGDAQSGRVWVQIAASQNKAAFAAEFKRLTGKAPTLLSGKTAWTAPFRSTNRLLVGPFGTEKEARDLVNELAKLEIDSFSWTSPEGQEIEKIGGK